MLMVSIAYHNEAKNVMLEYRDFRVERGMKGSEGCGCINGSLWTSA